MSGTLINHRGAEIISKEELYKIVPPPGTATWKPIAHGVLVEAIARTLKVKGVEVRKEQYAVQRDGNLLFGVMDLEYGATQEFAASIGIRTSNDKTFCLQLAIGLRVFVCDNLVFNGDLIALKRKHTSGLDLDTELSIGIDRYFTGFASYRQSIGMMQSTVIQPADAREIIYTAFAQRIVPVRLYHEVALPYLDRVQPPTLWEVLNSFTSAAKKLKPGIQFDATVKLGRFFSRPPVGILPQVAEEAYAERLHH